MQRCIFRLLILLIISLFSCGPKKRTQHEQVSREEMIEILSEMYLLEGARTLNLEGIGRDSAKTAQYYAKLYESFEISPDEFSDAYSFYTQDQDEFSKMLNEVLEDFSKTELNP